MQTLNRSHRAPARPLPTHAADCHMHVFGPFDRYPLAAVRAYNVAEAPLAAHERMKRQVGLERTVLVQANGYGMDNRAMLAALHELGPRGRGIAVVALETPQRELQSMHAAGVRGVRLNLLTLAGRHPGDPGMLLQSYANLAAPLGWHVQLFASAATLHSLQGSIERCGVDVVIDHMGLPDPAAGTGQPAFQSVLRLATSGRAWVKCSGADRVTRATGRLADAIPFMRALAEAAPERLVWGSDWPNIGFHAGKQVKDEALLPHRELDAGGLLDLLAEAVPDAATRAAILAHNPQRLYGFGS
jgi:predicted TIM-barrel fold metal-dependent hydrolase